MELLFKLGNAAGIFRETDHAEDIAHLLSQVNAELENYMEGKDDE